MSRSSTEAEYRALASTTTELYWIHMLLCDFGLFLPHPPLLWCDNVSALAIATNPVFHARTKHIEEEEEGTPTARTPTANFSRTVSYRRLGKHKGRVKQNAIVSH